jgi:hypothetical protein
MTRRRELALFAAAYLIYNVARGVAIGGTSAAYVNAHAVAALERSLDLDVEGRVQRALDTPCLAWLLSYVYLSAQFVVLPLALVWLFRRAPDVYRLLRNAMLATWTLAVPIFVAFPVAPPRLASPGVTDTVSRQAAVTLTGRSTVLYNQFAAVPSLHVGFAVAVGIALACAARRRAVKLTVLLWGPLVAVAVIATGNHYVFDVAAGVLVTAAGFAAGALACVSTRRQENR